jgi:2-dehydro-3-deoxyphosphogluconate aldolase/(4S)-4-hydroxy-2-oxoglutarate aldolase
MVAFPPPQQAPPLAGQVIAVLRTTHASEYAPVIESLVAGGVRFIELTLTTRDVFDHLPDIRETFGDAAVARGIPIIPGGLTPTELHAGWSAGAAAVKVFPASTVGSDYIGQLHGPFPEMQLIPSGGISIQDAPKWISAGALAVSLGGPLIGDAFAGGSLTQLTQRARLVTELVTAATLERQGTHQ